MLRYAFLLFFWAGTLFSQSLKFKTEYTAGGPGYLAEFNVLKDTDDDKIYIVTREAINKSLYLALYDNSFNRLMTLPSTPDLDIEDSFIRNGKLYFSDSRLKYLSLSDYKSDEVNRDRKNIYKISDGKLGGKDVIAAITPEFIYIFDVTTNKEILNIKKENKEKNLGRIAFYNSDIYYTSEGNEISKFDTKKNMLAWSVKLPDKPVKLLGIRISSMPNVITCINPYKKNNREYIGVFTMSGDYFTFDPSSGRLVKDEVQFEKFDDLSQNNSKLFVNCYYYDDKAANNLLIYAGSVDHSVYCMNEKDCSTVWETSTENEIQKPLSYLDINKDGYPEVFGVNDYDSNLFVLDGKTGKKLVFKSLKEGKKFNQTKVLLADLYGTGTLNLIFMINKEKLKVFELSDIKVPKNFVSTF
jgi:outer membrane protein assembly factor BamB